MCFCCSSYDCSETKQTLVVAQWDVDFESAVSLRRTPLIQPSRAPSTNILPCGVASAVLCV